MGRYLASKDYGQMQEQKLGVLLVNLGTPTAPTAGALRVYLRQFLSDPRVIETPRLLWWFILNFIILPRRSPRSAAAYKQVWSKEGSPLLVHCRSQQHKLQRLLHSADPPIMVELGMSYGIPSIPQALSSLKERGMTHLLVLPLYPQYAGSTVGSVFAAVARSLSSWRWVPHLRIIHSYYDAPLFIKQLASSVIAFQRRQGKPQQLIFSFHGTPLSSRLAGDPYYYQCHKTARLVAEKLHLQETEYKICFQSRFGKEEWLQPYTDKTLEALPSAGVENVQVICPGFSSDCLETIEEIGAENRDIFIKAGGRRFGYIPCLNDSQGHISFLAYLVRRNIAGWVERRKERLPEKNKMNRD